MTKWLEIDQGNLQTGTAIGFRASRELLLKLLVPATTGLVVCNKLNSRW